MTEEREEAVAVKMHMMTGETDANGAEKTACGKVGWEERGRAYEYTTAEGHCFEGTDIPAKVTCLRCAATLEQ